MRHWLGEAPGSAPFHDIDEVKLSGPSYDEVVYDGNDEADDVKEYTVCNNRAEDTVTGGWVMLEYPSGH